MKLKFTNYSLRGESSDRSGCQTSQAIGRLFPLSQRERAGVRENCSNRKTLRHDAFTLMEVMIAIGVFCIGVFAILDVVASVLHGARLLDKPMVDAGCVAGEVALTNSLVEVQDQTGDLSEFLGDQYKGYAYNYGVTEVQSNHLYQVDIVVQSDAPGKPVISKMTMLLYRPQSPAGTLDGGMFGR